MSTQDNSLVFSKFVGNPNILKTFISFLLVFFFTISSSSSQTWLWGSQGLAKKGASIEGYSVASDKSGNAYLTGFFQNNVVFGLDTMKISSFADVYLVKFDVYGNAFWATQSTSKNTGFYDAGSSVVVDNSLNSFVTGVFSDTILFGPYSLSCPIAGNAAFIVKYDPNGNVVWAKQNKYSIHGNAWGTSVTSDLFGNTYITGNFQDTVVFGLDSLFTKDISSSDVFLVKYDSNGLVKWAKQSTNSALGAALGEGVTTDSQGNIYVTGLFTDTVHFGPFILPSNTTNAIIFLAKYDSAGTVLWAKDNGYIGSGNAGGMSVVTDNAENAYITGSFSNQIIIGKDTLNSVKRDIFLAKYSSSGNTDWAKQGYILDNNNWNGASISADTLCNIYISGYGGDSPCSIKFDNTTFNMTGPKHEAGSLLIKFDSAGKLLCGSIINGGGDDFNTVASDPSGNYVYLGGDLATIETFGSNTIGDTNSELPFVARWFGCSVNAIVAKSTIMDAKCQSDCNGIATVSVTGGIPPYAYSWNTSPTQTTQSATQLCPQTYSVTVTDFVNSSTTIPLTVNAKIPDCHSIYIPNAFSPNGDGQNDLLLAQSSFVETFYMAIYDRWGNMVFETYNINVGWDGTYKGHPENIGTYAYYVKGTYGDGTAFYQKGSVSLIR